MVWQQGVSSDAGMAGADSSLYAVAPNAHTKIHIPEASHNKKWTVLSLAVVNGCLEFQFGLQPQVVIIYFLIRHDALAATLAAMSEQEERKCKEKSFEGMPRKAGRGGELEEAIVAEKGHGGTVQR